MGGQLQAAGVGWRPAEPVVSRRVPRFVWDDLAVQILRVGYPDLPSERIAKDLGIGVKQVYSKAFELGLKKSPAFMAAELSGRIQRGKQHPGMVANQFKPGHQTWNKGMKYVAGGRSAETRFKKGRKPEEARNYLPIGSTRITKDGYLERKVTDDQSVAPARRWVAEHRLVWEAERGPVPRGHMVIFKPGMRTTAAEEIICDRLECISRAENARRNHPRSKSPELARLVQLKGAITRQVNRITRESKNQGNP